MAPIPKGTFAKFQAEDRKLHVLLILENAAGYTANHELLHMFLDKLAHVVSHDVIKNDLLWLEEQRLLDVTTEGDLMTATITRRGLDAANGRTMVVGVKRPMPGE
jgi:transcriptional regulator CtsR